MPAEALDAGLAEVFRTERLSALRELSLQYMAAIADKGIDPGHRLPSVIVALTGAPGGERLIRVALGVAERGSTRLVGVHVRSNHTTGPSSSSGLALARRELRASGGAYIEVASSDIAGALVSVAEAERAGRIIVGSSQRGRWTELTRGSMLSELIRRSPIDVHVVAPDSEDETPVADERRVIESRVSVLSRRRVWSGWILAVAAPCLTILLVTSISSITLTAALLLMLLAATSVAVVGGIGPAMFAAVESFLLCNWFLIPPLHRLTISNADDAVSLFSFLAVAVSIGAFVSAAARRSAEARGARSTAATLASMAGEVASLADPLPALVERLRDIYGADAAELHEKDGRDWVVVTATGAGGSADAAASMQMAVGESARLVIHGESLRMVDHDTAGAFLDQISVALEQRRLRVTEELVDSLARANELRSALLAAVSHDLRTPLAAVKAAVSTLRNTGIDWPADTREELLETIEISSDRLSALITNLLDMSRIQAGAVELRLEVARVDEIVHRSVMGLGARSTRVRVELDDGLPSVWCDAALVDHVVSNLADNAVKWSPDDAVVRIDGSIVDDAFHLRVIDRGPGIPTADRSRVREPFQRLGDAGEVYGTGLGLAVADGFATIMGARLLLDDTPGGGTTATLVIPLAEPERGAVADA